MNIYDGVEFYCPEEHGHTITYTIKDDGGKFVRIDWVYEGERKSLIESRSDVAQNFEAGIYVQTNAILEAGVAFETRNGSKWVVKGVTASVLTTTVEFSNVKEPDVVFSWPLDYVVKKFEEGYFTVVESEVSQSSAERKPLIVKHFKHRNSGAIYTIVADTESFDNNVISWHSPTPDSYKAYSGEYIREQFADGTWIQIQG